MLKFDLVLASAPFVGHSGYNSHSQNFFTALDNYIPVSVKNYTHCNELDHLTQKQKDMIIHQTWSTIPWEVGTPFHPKPGTKIINVCLFDGKRKNQQRSKRQKYSKWSGKMVG